MGAAISHCEPAQTTLPAGAAQQSPALAASAIKAAAPRTENVVNYMALPSPIKYEELQREAMQVLKPEVFEGMRFDFNKPLNQNFALCHSIFMGNVEVPTANQQVVKMPLGTYEFGANLVTNQGNMMIGRVLTDGRLTGRIKYDITPWFSSKVQLQLAQEAGMSQGMLDLEFKGSDWNGQVKLGSNEFFGLNYLQSVTPRLSLGGEAFWLGQNRKSGTGFAARLTDDKSVATVQFASTGLVSLAYVHRVSEKVSLATDFMWNWNTREPSASFGYDYVLRQCRLRGRIDTEGKIAALLEERINVGVNFMLSAELDHAKKDHKFGFGLTVGE